MVQDTENQLAVAEVQLTYKSKVKASDRAPIGSSKEAYQLKRLWNPMTIELQEEFKALLMSRSSQVFAVYTASVGGIAGTLADPKLIFVAALR